MIGTRKVTLGGLDYELSETQPDIFSLRELPDGPVLGSYTRVPSHGRFKETFRIIGTDACYTSEKEMWYLLQMRYWRNRAETDQPPPPLDTTGWLPAIEAAGAYGLTQTALLAAIRDGSIPAQRQANGKWLVAPPAAQPVPVAAESAPPNPRIARAQAIFAEPDPSPELEEPADPPPAEAEPDITGWLSVASAAAASGVTRSAVQFWLKDGRIRAVKRGSAWWIDPASLPQPDQTIAEVAPKDPPPTDVVIPEGWLRTRDAARAYGVSLTAIGEWAQQGKVPALKAPGPTGKIWWIAPPEVAPPAPVPAPPVEPLAEVTQPAPPMNGNGAAHTEPVAAHLLPPDPTLVTAIRDEARRAGRAEAEAAYLRAELARAQQGQARRRWPWSR